MTKVLLVALTALLSSQAAYADQCARVSEFQAVRALEVIQAAKTVQHFCKKCGETQPTIVPVQSVELVTFGGISFGQHSVSINGKQIDLAYTYVNGMNLALIVGCRTHGVDPSIAR